MDRFSRIAGSLAMAAALSMTAAPLSAASLPRAGSSLAAGPYAEFGHPGIFEMQEMDWRGRRYRDRGVSGGDILAGVLILGGIAAIASAASSSNNDRRVREQYSYREPYHDERPDYYESRRSSGSGIDNAVEMCVDQVERGNDRVSSVDNASRTGDGWRISGQLGAGGGFSCWIDNDGRIRNVDIGGGYYGSSMQGGYGASDDRQWDDDTYARARARAGAADPYDPYSDPYAGAGDYYDYYDYEDSGG